jgi:plastocyanin
VGQGTPGNAGDASPWAFTLPNDFGRTGAWTDATLVGIGGHLHPGGLTDNVDLVRGTQRTRIFTSEAKYWPRRDGSAPPDSWDLSMTVTGKPRWAVHVKPGDTLRISATYDSTLQSTYEDMGIAVAMLAPNDSSGLDPFAVTHDKADQCPSDALARNILCEKGVVTHGHMKEAENYGGPDGAHLTGPDGPAVQSVNIAAFQYYPGGQGTETASGGIPTVQKGKSVTFYNEDAAADIYHSITACQEPCNGATGIAYPLSNATVGTSLVDFDSGQLGYGIPALGPAKNDYSYVLDTSKIPANSVLTYFCRVHPSMRGELKVVGP